MGRGVGACVAACAVVFMMGMGAHPPVDLGALQAEIQQQLPAGTDMARVVEFLDAHHLKHSWLVAPERAIYARVPIGHSVRGGVVSNQVELQFWFGRDNRLIHFAVRDRDRRLS